MTFKCVCGHTVSDHRDNWGGGRGGRVPPEKCCVPGCPCEIYRKRTSGPL